MPKSLLDLQRDSTILFPDHAVAALQSGTWPGFSAGGTGFTVTATATAAAFQTSTALVALGAGGAATLGLTGGTGPATTTQNTWLRVLDSTGAACWVPVWK